MVLCLCALVVSVNCLTNFSVSVIKCLYSVYCELLSFYFLSINYFMSISQNRIMSNMDSWFRTGPCRTYKTKHEAIK